MKNDNLNEYLAVISPDERVSSDVMEMKLRCKEKFGSTSAIYSRAHLTIFNIIQPALNEERLIKCLERNIEKINPFKINLNGIDNFSNNSAVLYVKLEDEKEFYDLSQNIREFTRSVLKSIKGYPPRFTYKGHITIAKDIPNAIFPKVWESLKNLEYQSSTTASGIVLLKRPFTYLSSSYEVVGNYSFLGKGHFDPQMSLF